MSLHQPFCFLAFLILLTQACTSDETININQESIFTEFETFYIESENRTYAKAIFRYKDNLGRILKLSSPSQVYFNEDLLTYNENFQQYEKIYEGFVKEGTFLWKNTEGKTCSNSVVINEVNVPEVDTISKNSSFSISWIGQPLQENEWMTLIFSEIQGAGAQIIKESSTGATSIVLSPQKLYQVSSGSVTVILERSFSQNLDQKTEAGGSLLGRYRPLSKEAYLK